MHIRKATKEDVPAILPIYNDAILHTTATFDLKEKTLPEMQQWFLKFNDTYPLIVAELDGKVVGYCSLSQFREKEGYKQTVEISVYVDKNARGNGVASKLMHEIIELTKEANHHVIMASITKGNDVSVGLHERFGFTYVGCLAQVGYKFGEWQDALYYQLILS
ncbi:GNAT family N-acetyltransferase [Microbacteriaceae bacterium 4G12]